MKKFLFPLVLCLSLTACASSSAQAPSSSEGIDYDQVLTAAPVAEIEGDPVSPDGAYRLEAVGETDLYVSGVRLPETLRLVAEDGTVLWEDQGWVRQEVTWSADSRYAAIYTAARTWGALTVVDTQTAQSQTVTLPEGSPFGEYVFLEEMEWREEGNLFSTSLVFSLRGTDEETDHYRYFPGIGYAFEETMTTLEGSFDFDHDGVEEQAQLHTIYSGDPYYCELRIMEQDQCIWLEEAHPAHVGWNTVFACKLDGEDYLLRYNPYMSTGIAGYSYRLFSLDQAGNEVVKAENAVEFDANFGSPVHQPMDVEAVTAFLQEAYGYLQTSTLLLSTQDGDLWPTVSGEEFFWKSGCYFDLPQDMDQWEETIRAYEQTA